MSVNTFGLSQETLRSLRTVFQRYPKISEVLIYGSRAKGNFRQGSDIDLCLVGSELTTSDLFKIENEIDDLLLPYKVDLSILSQIENSGLVAHIQRESKKIFERIQPKD